MTPDAELLRAYAKDRSEPAFAELVRRHINLVYSVALRNLAGDTQLAEDVTQQVFTALAQKAGALSHHAVLGGWLYRCTQFAAAKTVRSERRRRWREQEAEAMHASSASPEPEWEKLRPTLDRLIGELDERDRDAVWLRFVANQSYADIGTRLGLSENAARMRVDRALAKIYQRLTRDGITSSLAALGTALSGQARSIAPAGLAGAVLETVATIVPAAGPVLFGGSPAASLALFFAGGLLLGGAAASALPEEAISGGEPSVTARVLWSSGVTPVVTRLRSLTSSVPTPTTATAPPGLLPDVDRILKEVGLHAAARDAGPAPSWLYVGAPKNYLLKSPEYAELSITAFEGNVDAAAAPLFLQLNLSPEATDQLRRTMAEMLHARIETEVLAQAREPKPGRDDVIRLLDTSDEEYRQKIRSQLGETHFVQFEAYFDSLLIRNGMVNFFAEAALRTSPFTPAQRDTLVAAVQAQSQGRTAEPFADGQFTPAQLALLDAWLPGYLSNNARSREIRAKYERDPARRAQASGRDIYERAGAFAGLP
jgi:RNA polymerase sigma factor (sigma-70 family)